VGYSRSFDGYGASFNAMHGASRAPSRSVLRLLRTGSNLGTACTGPMKGGNHLVCFTLNAWIDRPVSEKSNPGDRDGIFTRWFGSRREAGRLARDAATIIETARAVSSSERIRDIALRIRDDLDIAHARADGDPTRYAPIIEHFRTQHREARRRRDDSALTALTLTIIHLRAETLGADADSARDRIDAFISEWTQV